MNLVGTVLADRYEIIEEIGSGGMAVVYKAKCKLLHRFVAVKVLREDLQSDEEFVRRFNVEAQAAASLTHNNIVSIYDVGTYQGLHYIVMEYVEGETLKDYIDKNHELPWREAVAYTMQICRGLEQAHKNSIVHRDIKPHNIIMTKDGLLKVTDFGIARANVQSTIACEKKDATALGSVHYISPEQARGGYTDERTDIYSLGIVMYEMLTGRVPFDNDNPVTVAIKQIQENPVPPREYNLSIPFSLEKVVLKAIAKDINTRYKNVTEIIDDLQIILDDPHINIVSNDEKETKSVDDSSNTILIPAINSKTIKKHTDKLSEKPIDDAVEFPSQSDDESLVNDEEFLAKDKKKEIPMNKQKKTNNSEHENVDSKKERKVITAAILSSAVIILAVFFAFLKISGLGSMLWSSTAEVKTPNLVGMVYEEAVEKYQDSNFSIIKDSEKESDEDEGTILEQDPTADKKVKNSDKIIIKVVVSSGSASFKLKDYTKYTDYRKAEIEVEKLGLSTKIVEQYDALIPIGSIISQRPSSNLTVSKGETVTFYVSKGPDPNSETNNENVDHPASNGSDSVSSGTGDSTTSTPSSGSVGNTPSPGVNTTTPKKSTLLTVYGPKNKDAALVQVNVNGNTVYSKNLSKGASDVVRLEGSSNTAEVEILYDGVSQQTKTVQLH